MTNLEQEQLLRDTFEALISTTLDAEEIRRAVLTIAQALDCPTAKKISLAQMGEIFGISRQAVHKRVDKMAGKIAGIKENCRTSQLARLTPSSLSTGGR